MMKGRRPLTDSEERRVIAIARQSSARDRALLSTQLFTGFRIAEVLSLTVGQVQRQGRVMPQVGVAPRHLKGRRGATRWVPVSHELRDALESYLPELQTTCTAGALPASHPLFPSPLSLNSTKKLRAMSTAAALKIICALFAKARVHNDGRLGTHTLRKTFARKVYELSGHDIFVTRAALGHSSIAITEQYLTCDPREVDDLILKGDWTRRPRKSA